MFSYYGSKSKIINKYPDPSYDTIIEPFAGSARYAFKFFDRDIILIEKYEKVYKIWEYLQSASKSDILSLPDIEPQTVLAEINGYTQLADVEKYLIGFCVNRGSRNTPKTVSGKFCNWNTDKLKIAKNLYKIKHWNIIHGDYRVIENKRATWFIDPPYEIKGKIYPEKIKDYKFLGKWCKSRLGQVIVCENYGANWLDFEYLTDTHGQHRKSKEVVWYSE